MSQVATADTFHWSFVDSASSQSQLTGTLAGISITAMVLVLSPLFLGPRTAKVGAAGQAEIRDLFKYLLIAFTALVAASMLWGQLNGYSHVEDLAWQGCTRGSCPNAEMFPIHLLFIACASLTTLGVVALSVALLELVLLSSADPAGLTRLVLGMYAVTVSLASLQVLFGLNLVVADIGGDAIANQTAMEWSASLVPIIVVVGLAPAALSWWRRRHGVAPTAATSSRFSLTRVESWMLLAAGLLSGISVQVAPELTTNVDSYGPSRMGAVLAVIGAVATIGYACLIWWSLWRVADRLSVEPRESAIDDVPSLGAVRRTDAPLVASNAAPRPRAEYSASSRRRSRTSPRRRTRRARLGQGQRDLHRT